MKTDWEVGDECMYCSDVYTIRAIEKDEVCIYSYNSGLLVRDISELKPPKTPEQQRREDVIKNAVEVLVSEMAVSGVEMICEVLYDAGILGEQVVPISEDKFYEDTPDASVHDYKWLLKKQPY